jgi:predicted amidophosphoribosyltransferase
MVVRAPFWYEDELVCWIRQVKEGGHEALLDRLAGAWCTSPLPLEEGLRLVPVPAQALRRRERGGDHVARLAGRWARTWGLSCVQPLDRQGVSHQIGLTARERLRNLEGQYRLKERGLRPGPVWLVDDVVTTGATLLTCRRLLERAGWRVRGALALALTPHPLLRGNALAGLEAQLDGSP